MDDGKDPYLRLEFGKIMDTMYPVKMEKLGILYTNSKSLSAFEFTGWPVGRLACIK
jgi:hypothetical protein